jgi:hypothetical protein
MPGPNPSQPELTDRDRILILEGEVREMRKDVDHADATVKTLVETHHKLTGAMSVIKWLVPSSVVLAGVVSWLLQHFAK